MKDCFKNFLNRLRDSQQICDESMQSNTNSKEFIKEKRGIYNVTFNDKKSTAIKTEIIKADLELIEEAIIQEVIMYVKGYHDMRRDKGMGAEHIKIHLEENSEGQITIEELLNLGNFIREYLKVFNEPFVDAKNMKIYEWENEDGVRFRAVVDEPRHKDTQRELGGPQLPLPPTRNAIITFYSDRNLKQHKGYDKMQFQNPQVEQYYQEIQHKRRKP